jgi:hypothetical protein
VEIKGPTLLGLLAGVIIIAVTALAIGGHDSDAVTTALVAALATIVGVIVTAYTANKNANIAVSDASSPMTREGGRGGAGGAGGAGGTGGEGAMRNASGTDPGTAGENGYDGG